MKKQYYRAKECAEYLGIGLSTFLRWVAEGQIPEGYRLTARATVWNLKDIESFVKSKPRSNHE